MCSGFSLFRYSFSGMIPPLFQHSTPPSYHVKKTNGTLGWYALASNTRLNFLHYPKMGQAQHPQRGCFHKLQYRADELSEDTRSSNDVIVRAEDNRSFNKLYWQTVK